ncbi:hypothetical protein EB796_023558 [Bugula neritina]|uniref:Uncharacterized protein n=1 Tax=Bugula neritina TaxID=10212 RepID=A0A7J7IW50_BUGNE|nr:hypothetical protein EB796_023558 [Bugula neritina]
MLRMRDLETREAYRHERKLTAKKIKRQREKRSNSASIFSVKDQQLIGKPEVIKKQRSKSIAFDDRSYEHSVYSQETSPGLLQPEQGEGSQFDINHR